MLSRGKKIGVVSLSIGLVAIGGYAWYFRVGRSDLYLYIVLGLAMAGVYLYCDGELPAILYRYTRINRDDDSSNLSPKLYLPILLAAIIVAAILLKYGARR